MTFVTRAGALLSIMLCALTTAPAPGHTKGTAMTPFQRAQAAFRREVAAVYHKKEAALHVAPEGEETDALLREGLRQVRASAGGGAVGAVVEVAPWSRIPETRALVVPRDVR